MNNLLKKIQKDFDDIKFVEAERFSWSPESSTIYIGNESKNPEWSLLHELGHKLSDHTTYISDFVLLKMEAEAWAKAKKLGKDYNVQIDNEYIEKCLDSYRDWLYLRSACPRCSQAGIEKETGKYTCINCSFRWSVTPERFCRVYRKTITK